MFKILKNKLFLAIFLFFIFTFTFSKSIFAYSCNLGSFTDQQINAINEVHNNLKDTYPYFMAFYHNHKIYVYNYNNQNVYFYLGEPLNGGIARLFSTPNTDIFTAIINADDCSITYDSGSWFGSSADNLDGLNGAVKVYGNVNIYTDIDKSEVFFQVPPVELEILTLEGMELETLPQMIVRIVKIILPICLAVFGILLLVFLIKSKNLLHL